MPEHFLNGTEICSSLEQVGRKRVPEQVGVDPLGVEARFLGQLPEDQEGAGPGQGPAFGVQEELRAVPAVEERPAS